MDNFDTVIIIGKDDSMDAAKAVVKPLRRKVRNGICGYQVHGLNRIKFGKDDSMDAVKAALKQLNRNLSSHGRIKSGKGVTDMVKLILKQIDDSNEDQRWVCKTIKDHRGSAAASTPTESMDPESTETLPSDDEYLNEETEDCHDKIPSCPEIEMEEFESPCSPSRRDSAESIANTAIAHSSTCGFESSQHLADHNMAQSTFGYDGARDSCSDPMDLSTSYSKLESQRDGTSNVYNKSPAGAHASKSKFLKNVNAKNQITSSLNRTDKILTDETGFHSPKAVLAQNPSSSRNDSQTSSGDLALAVRTVPNNNSQTITPRIVLAPNPSSSRDENQTSSEDLALAVTTVPNNCRNFSLSIHRDSPISFGISMPNELVEDLRVNNMPPNSTTHLKRPSVNCEVSTAVNYQKRRKSHEKDTNKTYHCPTCKSTYKTANGFKRHNESEKHIKLTNRACPKQSNLCNFETSSASTSSRPTNLLTPLPLPFHPGMYHQFLLPQYQTHATTATNQSASDRAKISNCDVQNSDHRKSKANYNEDSLVNIRSQDDLRTKSNTQNPSHMNFPFRYPANFQGTSLPPNNHQPENYMIAKARSLEKKPLQPSRTYTDVSAPIQAGNFTEARLSQNPEVIMPMPRLQVENESPQSNRLHKDIWSHMQSGNITFFQRPGVVSVPHYQVEVFRVYHCLVCSAFHTDSLQELERHICTDRSRTPSELIVTSADGIFCILCRFKAPNPEEMGRHCSGCLHLNGVEYYNHVMEGDFINRSKMYLFHDVTPVLIHCSACEFTIKSMMDLKTHHYDLSHLHNVACCLYLTSVRTEIEYFFCVLCNVKALKKQQLIEHVRSKEHFNKVRQYPVKERIHFELLFFAKEKNLIRRENPLASEQPGNIERLHCKDEDSKKLSITETLPPVYVGSSSFTSLEPATVSCTLCQQILPEIHVLVLHLRLIHGVSDAGLKWLVPKTITEGLEAPQEKTLTRKDLADAMSSNLKYIALSPQISASVTDEKLPVKRMNFDYSSHQSSVATEQGTERESSTGYRTATSGHNYLTKEHFDQSGAASTGSDSKQQFYEKERMENPEKVDHKPLLYPAERASSHSSSNQQLCCRDSMRKFHKMDENVDFDPEKRIHLDYSPKPLQIDTAHNSVESSDSTRHKIMIESKSDSYVDIKDEAEKQYLSSEKIANSDELLHRSFTPVKIIDEFGSKPNGNSKNEVEIDYPPIDMVSNPNGMPHSNSSPAKMMVEMGSEPNDDSENEEAIKDPSSEIISKSGGKPYSNSSHHEIIEKMESEPNGDSTTEEEIEYLSCDTISNTDGMLNRSFSQAEIIGEIGTKQNENCDNGDKTKGPSKWRTLKLDEKLNSSALQTEVEIRSEPNRDVKNDTDIEGSPSKNSSTTDDGSVKSPLSIEASRERADSSSSNHTSASRDSLPGTDDWSSDSFVSTENESPSFFHTDAENDGYSSSDEINIIYEGPASKRNPLPNPERGSVYHFPSIQQNLLDYRNRKLPSEDDSDPNSRTNVDNDFPLTKLKALVESTSEDSQNKKSPSENRANPNLKRKVENDSQITKPAGLEKPNGEAGISTVGVNENSEMSQMESCDLPIESDETDPQVQARKNIENIEILSVFSLIGSDDNIQSTDEEEEGSNMGNILYGDL